MSITGAQLATDAMFQAGVLGQDGTSNPNGDADIQLTLRILNRMLDSWSNERLMIYQLTTETLALVANTAAYSSSTLTQRPVAVEDMNVSYGGVSYPIMFIDSGTYSAIPINTIAAIPNVCWINTGFPNMTFTFYPVPFAAMTATLTTRRVLSTAIAVATVVSMPPGYEKALVTGLALEICPSFRMEATPLMVQQAKDARAALKVTNYVPLEMSTDFDTDATMDLAYMCRPW